MTVTKYCCLPKEGGKLRREYSDQGRKIWSWDQFKPCSSSHAFLYQ